MGPVLAAVVTSLASFVRSRCALQLEVLAPRHQLAVYQRSGRRARLRPVDRVLWTWRARAWSGWQDARVVVQPRTVIAGQRQRFRAHWTWPSQHTTPGRPRLAKDVRALIHTRSTATPTWGSPRLVSELRKLGTPITQATVERDRVRRRRPPSPTWRACLAPQAKDLVSMDFFTGATVRFEIVFVLVILTHARRHVRHCNSTTHPTAACTAQQISEAFPWDSAPAYLLHDRDGVSGIDFRTRVAGRGITEVRTAPRSPWQSPYVERLIGSIRREGLDHVVVLHARPLRRTLHPSLSHYQQWRCHQGLAMDCPQPRAVQPPEKGAVVAVLERGGLYRPYERRAASRLYSPPLPCQRFLLGSCAAATPRRPLGAHCAPRLPSPPATALRTTCSS